MNQLLTEEELNALMDGLREYEEPEPVSSAKKESAQKQSLDMPWLAGRIARANKELKKLFGIPAEFSLTRITETPAILPKNSISLKWRLASFDILGAVEHEGAMKIVEGLCGSSVLSNKTETNSSKLTVQLIGIAFGDMIEAVFDEPVEMVNELDSKAYATEQAVAIELSIMLDKHTSKIQILCPEKWIEKNAKRSIHRNISIPDEMKEIEVPMVIELGKKVMTLSDILRLREGDRIVFGTKVGSPVTVKISGRKLYEAELGQKKNKHLAVKLLRKA